jgi:hypothetical protein
MEDHANVPQNSKLELTKLQELKQRKKLQELLLKLQQLPQPQKRQK